MGGIRQRGSGEAGQNSGREIRVHAHFQDADDLREYLYRVGGAGEHVTMHRYTEARGYLRDQRNGQYASNGSDERQLATEYYRRVGYRDSRRAPPPPQLTCRHCGTQFHSLPRCPNCQQCCAVATLRPLSASTAS